MGCNGDVRSVNNGDTVKLHYTGRLKNGDVFDTTENREPLEVALGQGLLIPGFEEAVIGMKVGKSKTVTIPAKKAFGPHLDDLVAVVPRDQLPEGPEPRVGDVMYMKDKEGKGSPMGIRAIVTDVSEKTITIDANHPLAGKDLTFDIKILEIK
ncbi:MAG: peptidylprolyl isomerase [Chloroflexi bacterium]|nr:peptidylprolyl isomerase [Chloroflexota bacterium]MBM4452729.1 peptidylprolyl isomerase [Chloroflexota bacterium]MBM4453760.1 peptidylprolyl isomerase [Chloroflexota bacterium]